MAKLTDTQLMVLSRAASQDEGHAIVPPKLNKAAASKVGSSLVARKLMREIKTKAGLPIWREDADGKAYSLIITAAGRKAIGGEAIAPTEAAPSPIKALPNVADPNVRAEPGAGTVSPKPSSIFREGSKSADLVTMLSASDGATLDAIVAATGWLPHTTRAALTGLRKRGFVIERSRREDKRSVYRIASPEPTSAGSHKGAARSGKADVQATG